MIKNGDVVSETQGMVPVSFVSVVTTEFCDEVWVREGFSMRADQQRVEGALTWPESFLCLRPTSDLTPCVSILGVRRRNTKEHLFDGRLVDGEGRQPTSLLLAGDESEDLRKRHASKRKVRLRAVRFSQFGAKLLGCRRLEGVQAALTFRADYQLVRATAKLAFQVLQRPDALEGASDHDRSSVREGFHFLQMVRREND